MCAAVVFGLAATAGAASAGAQSTTASTGAASGSTDGLSVQVGINDPKDPTIAVLQYMPAKVTVAVGATVTFTWDGTIEPHSVTFLAPGQQLPAPGSDVSLFLPTPPTDRTTAPRS